MKTQDNDLVQDFHAVDYMRQIREKLSQMYLTDKQKYLQYVQKAMEDFKLRQSEASR